MELQKELSKTLYRKMKLITKKTFNQIFATYYNRQGKKLFVRVDFNFGIIYINLGHLHQARQDFEDKILKIGFHHWGVFFRLQISPEYQESVKNLFDLALSNIKGNRELAYQIFQNIRGYAILESPEPIVEVPKPIETPPEKVDFSKYQLGNVEYSEEDFNYLISKSITKKIKKTHKKQINLFSIN